MTKLRTTGRGGWAIAGMALVVAACGKEPERAGGAPTPAPGSVTDVANSTDVEVRDRNGAGGAAGGAKPADASTSPSTAIGAPCTSDAECGSGTCLSGATPWWSTPFEGGYCSLLGCDSSGCPSGSDCFVVEESPRTTACLASCAGGGACPSGQGCFEPGACLPGAGSPTPAAQTQGSPVGGPCTVDSDCPGANGKCIAERSGRFLGGYCIVEACNENAPCPAGSDCFSIDENETACLPTCDVGQAGDCRSSYVCQNPGVCLPECTSDSCATGQVCGSDGLCQAARCTPSSCGAGLVCDGVSGACVPEGADALGAIPACGALPDWRCTGGESYCGELLPFDPDLGRGYWDYPINGETPTNQYRSYIRRDVMMIVKYASAAVDCLGAAWSFGNRETLGLGDMSESNGAIPGTAIGSPGHPAGTHVFGHDMDIAYYQLRGPDNKLREICPTYQNGRDQLHCVAPPDNLDVWRTALFIGKIHETPQLRVIGADGQVGPLVESAIAELCRTGWLTGNACNRLQLTYEVTDEGRGWFLFHDHHFHISLRGQRTSAELPGTSGKAACLSPDCSAKRHDVSTLGPVRPERRLAPRVSFPTQR